VSFFYAWDRPDLLQDRKATLTEGYVMISSVEEGRHNGAVGGVGNDLRSARERLGWALEDVASTLRIRLVYLTAIEQGRFGELPGRAYALGFVRSYAKLLGLEGEEIARRFRSEARDITGRPALEFPAPVPDRGVPAGALVLLGVLLAVGAYVGWYRMSGDRPGEAVVQTVPDRLLPLVQTAPPVTASQPLPPAPQVAVVPPMPGLPTYSPTSAGAAMPPPMLAAPAQAAPATVPPPGPGDSRIIVRARADSWIQVRDKAGQTVFNRVLRPGETFNVPPKQQLLLTTGNAGGVDLVVDGAVAPSLGATGVVRRDLPLDPDVIRTGKFPMQKPGATP